jgi:hypothetical protein
MICYFVHSARITLLLALTAVCLILPAVAPLHAQEAVAQSTSYRMLYRPAKSIVTTAFRSASTLEARQAAILMAAEVAYGSRARTALGGAEAVLARTQGGLELAHRLAVDNRSVRKGALRAARVAGSIDSDPRFKLVELDQRVLDANGKLETDRDIVYRHRATGSLGRIEVKDVTPASQRSKKARYKRQIDLMSAEKKRTGQFQAFVNRRPVLPELREYARARGVAVYDNVVTSERNYEKQGTLAIGKVIDDIDRRTRVRFRRHATGAAFGVLTTVHHGKLAAHHWTRYMNGESHVSEVAYHTLLSLSGGSLAASSAASMLSSQVNPSSRASRMLSTMGKRAGVAGTAFAVGALGVRAYQWRSGAVTSRQFVLEAGTATGGLAGAWAGGAAGGLAGAKVGGVIGLVIGPEGVPPGAAIGGVVGTIAGALAGGWAGQTVAAYGIESFYSRLDDAEQEKLFGELKLYYRAQAQ